MAKIWSYIKPLATAIAVIMILKVTGLLGSVSYVAQSALLQAGVRNADDSSEEYTKDFDFNFVVQDLKGDKIDFSTFKGKVVFVNLWATWCGPCRAEMPGIQKLHNSIDSKEIAFVMLSLDKNEHKQKVIDYIQKHEFTFPTYRPSGYLPEQLNVPSIPTTLIISREGKIVSTEVGATNFNTKKFRNYLLKLAAE